MTAIQVRFRAFRAAALGAALLVAPSIAHAIPITGSGLGSFSGSFDYSWNGSVGTVSVVLDNTSADLANQGFITAFVFNLPDGASATSVILVSSDTDFGVIGGPTFNNDIIGSPHGRFDIGASTGGGFEGGGDPHDGIAIGDPAVLFTFTLTGSGLGSLTAADFLSTVSAPPGDGGDLEALVVRFRGFVDGDSDKVPIDPPIPEPIPEPGSLLLLASGAAALLARRRRSA